MKLALVAVAAAVVICSANAALALEGGATGAYEKYAGVWALDCAKPDLLSADIQAKTLVFAVNGKTIPTKNLESSVSEYLNEPNFQISFSGEFANDMSAGLEIWKDKKGLYGKLSGHPAFERQLGGGEVRRLEFCDPKK